MDVDPRAPALYQQFDPTKPLEATDEARYVDWQKQLAADDIKPRLARSLALSGSLPVCRFVTGHRGVGKSTELKRVARILEQGEIDGQKRFVSFMEAEQWMDLADVRSEDIVFHIVRQLVTDLDQRAGIRLGSSKFGEFLQEIADVLNQDVEIAKIGVKLGPVSLEAVTKDNPLARTVLRNLLRGRLPTIYDLINREILKPSREDLRRQGFTDLLVIVDQLDRIPQKVINEQGLTNHTQLFLDNSRELRFLDCDIVYTVPIELAYSQQNKRLEVEYSSEIFPMPVIPVTDSNGLGILHKVVEQRAAQAGLGIEDLFENRHLLDRVCRLSGGHLRFLFLLLRSSMERSNGLPITGDAVNRAVKSQAASTARPLGAREWRILDQVHQSKRKPESEEDLIVFHGFLRDLYVFAYSGDGEDWYDWNPLLAEARRHAEH